jgi:enamine deaminase RidA (YjgF/YER057c/UK114 family)
VERRALNPDPWSWQDRLDFSHAIEVSNVQRTVYCAGQVSCDETGSPLYPGDMEAQFSRALDNLERVLATAGDLKLGDIVRLDYYVTDVPAFIEAVPKVGVRLKAAGCKPASTLLGVARLARPEYMIEIEATACA